MLLSIRILNRISAIYDRYSFQRVFFKLYHKISEEIGILKGFFVIDFCTLAKHMATSER
jgi:hypothetical protein